MGSDRTYHVYIMSNISKMLYTGVTNDLERRVCEHRQKLIPGFTRRYNLFKLVYAEPHGEIRAAIAREKEIKRWARAKKVALVKSVNPKWQDMVEDWFRKKPALRRVSS